MPGGPILSGSGRASAVLVGAVLLGGAWWALAADSGPVIPRGQGDACVAETDYMRRYHMDLIVHQRDETVIKGIRDEPFSLVECVDCHVQSDTNGEIMRVDAEGQFCASCHTYAAVKIDCFSCHAAVPADTSKVGEVFKRDMDARDLDAAHPGGVKSE